LHLQISPDSILVGTSGAFLQEPTKETDRLTSGFAAPEIYKGVGLGMASDIYSFAAVLYFAAFGKMPTNSLWQDLLETEWTLLEEKEPAFTDILRNTWRSCHSTEFRLCRS